MNSSYLMFLFMVLISPLIGLSSSDWVISWLGMEVGMFGLIPLLMLKSGSKEPVMKYFLIQSLSSALILIAGILLFSHIFNFSLLFILGMSMKLGFFPGHFWVISVIENLSWFSNMMVLGPVKIAPFGFLSLIENTNMFLILSSLSIFAGAILGLNQSNIRGMLGASSISHSGWMILAMIYGFLWMYMVIYMMILMFTFISLNNFEFLTSSMCLISMSGLPPFMMFLAKMKVFFYLSFNLEYIVFSILIVSSVISLFYYLKFFYYYSLISKNSKFLFLN
uniref:NADH-ubiquinone oxidoreductase chain 2 n=1 Tax=Bathyomphalus contortus TaxID=419017 RepID=A0A7D6WF94_9GAST|nr:NADH dehydrogenase subunit 2 [Bathyomphalus contortus]